MGSPGKLTRRLSRRCGSRPLVAGERRSSTLTSTVRLVVANCLLGTPLQALRTCTSFRFSSLPFRFSEEPQPTFGATLLSNILRVNRPVHEHVGDVFAIVVNYEGASPAGAGSAAGGLASLTRRKRSCL